MLCAMDSESIEAEGQVYSVEPQNEPREFSIYICILNGGR